jgi:hypothetical protein
MAGEVFATLSAFKSMYDMAKALKDINDATIRNGAVIELQEKILAAREAQATLLDQVGALEKEVARLKTWDADKERYELKDLYRGFFAYILKEGKEAGEASHALCTNCYQMGFKSILQCGGQINVHERTCGCPNCDMTVKSQFNDVAALIKRSRQPKEQPPA